MSDTLLLEKIVDKSVLFQGLSIPVVFQQLFYEKIGFSLRPGERYQIKIMQDGALYEYEAILVNQKFNQKKYQGHKDILQIYNSLKNAK